MAGTRPQVVNRSRHNIGAIVRHFQNIATAFDPSDTSIVQDAMDRQGDAIHERFEREEGLDGRFEENRGKYGERKQAAGLNIGVGLEFTGDRMGDAENFRGRRELTPEGGTMAFGATEESARKGPWFHNGGTPGDDGTEASGTADQPAREFWGFSEEDVEAHAEAALDDVMSRWWGRTT